MEVTIDSPSAEFTRRLGERIGAHLPRPALVFLDGPMGSGKTLFTKGLYVGLGGDDVDQVTSPSYTLVNVYEEGRLRVIHVDLYRLDKVEQLLGMEYEDFLLLQRDVSIVEWPDLARQIVRPDSFIEVRFAPGRTDDERTILVASRGEQYRGVFEELSSS